MDGYLKYQTGNRYLNGLNETVMFKNNVNPLMINQLHEILGNTWKDTTENTSKKLIITL